MNRGMQPQTSKLPYDMAWSGESSCSLDKTQCIERNTTERLYGLID